MKRKIALFITTVSLIISNVNTFAYASSFTDINDLPWSGAAQYIDEAYNLKLMAGYNENGKLYFKAKNNVTYCETVQLIYAIMYECKGETVSSDVVNKWLNTMSANNIPSWAYNSVAYALENSIISTNDIKIFMQGKSTQNNARREDVAVIFGKALAKFYTINYNPWLSYADNYKIESTSLPYVDLLNKLGIMVGDSNNNFNPKVNINRAEMSVLVSKTYKTLSNAASDSNATLPATNNSTTTLPNTNSSNVYKTDGYKEYNDYIPDFGKVSGMPLLEKSYLGSNSYAYLYEITYIDPDCIDVYADKLFNMGYTVTDELDKYFDGTTAVLENRDYYVAINLNDDTVPILGIVVMDRSELVK